MAKIRKICCKLKSALTRCEEGSQRLEEPTLNHQHCVPIRRWRRLSLGLLGIWLSGLPFLTPEAAAATSAPGCADVHIVFARGSGEALGGTNYQAWHSAMQTEVAAHFPELGLAYYELGQSPQGGQQYPAAAVGFDSAEAALTTLSAVVNVGEAGRFQSSVDAGVAELKNYVANTLTGCPEAHFALGGYSQGALVLMQALPELPAERILYTATFGDPELYLPEGAPQFLARPLACSGQDLSPYRVNVPDCTVYQGVLGGRNPYTPGTLTHHTGAWCAWYDLMCGAKIDLGNLLGGHTSYQDIGSYQEAARQVRARVETAFANTAEDYTPAPLGGSPSWRPVEDATAQNASDLKLFIDVDALSSEQLATAAQQLQTLAVRTLGENRGRLGVYLWRDTAGGQMLSLVALGSSFSAAQSAISRLAALGESDWRSARNFSSQAEAVRFLSGQDPWYSSELAQLEYHSGDLAQLNQQLFAEDDSLANYFPSDVTEAATTAITDLASGLDSLIQAYSPSSRTANAAVNMYSTVAPLATTGAATLASTATAAANSKMSAAEILGVRGARQGSTAQITVNDKNAALILVVVNGTLLGQTNLRDFTLVNLTEDCEIQLIPYDASGQRGNPRSLILPASDTPQTVQSGNVPGFALLAPDTGVGNPFGVGIWFRAWPGVWAW